MKALIVVDMQNDFLPGGSLGVPDGDRIVPVINRLMHVFDLVVASQDCHPKNHCSLQSNHPGSKPGDIISINGMEQVIWPDHCIEGSEGAQLTSRLEISRIRKIFKKGQNPQIDSYSCFFDNGHFFSTGLEDFLKENKVTEVFLVGLAIDYCVRYSALDAINCGFETSVIIDASRGINIIPGDVQKAITEMVTAGVNIVTAEMLLLDSH